MPVIGLESYWAEAEDDMDKQFTIDTLERAGFDWLGGKPIEALDPYNKRAIEISHKILEDVAVIEKDSIAKTEEITRLKATDIDACWTITITATPPKGFDPLKFTSKEHWNGGTWTKEDVPIAQLCDGTVWFARELTKRVLTRVDQHQPLRGVLGEPARNKARGRAVWHQFERAIFRLSSQRIDWLQRAAEQMKSNALNNAFVDRTGSSARQPDRTERPLTGTTRQHPNTVEEAKRKADDAARKAREDPPKPKPTLKDFEKSDPWGHGQTSQEKKSALKDKVHKMYKEGKSLPPTYLDEEDPRDVIEPDEHPQPLAEPAENDHRDRMLADRARASEI